MQSRPLIVGLDASTTACKAVVWDEAGEAVADGRTPLSLDNPSLDAYEQDAETWWAASLSAIGQATAQLGSQAARIAALCIAHQRETFVITDDACQPLHPALVWMDARCRPEVDEAVAALGEETLHRISGKPPCTTPSFYKLLFLLRRGAPALRSRLFRCLDVHAFLAWRLTGRCATSLASADPMGLVDMERRDWSEPLLRHAGLDRSQLPDLLEPGAELGRLTPTAAAACGLKSGLPVIAGAGDGQAAGLGAGLASEGPAYLNLGTAVVSGVLSPGYRTAREFRTMYGAAPGTFLLETDLKGGTFTVSWLLERFAPRAGDASGLLELEAHAAALPPGAEGLVLVPYWNGVMNPYWDDDATGVVVGWRGRHRLAHLYRALLEGIALEQRLHTHGVEQALGAAVDTFVAVGGGATSDLWCRILADATGKRLVRAEALEATALGAGALAAAGVGIHPNVAGAVSAMTRRRDTFEPGADAGFYGRLYEEVYRGLYSDLRERMRRLARVAP